MFTVEVEWFGCCVYFIIFFCDHFWVFVDLWMNEWTRLNGSRLRKVLVEVEVGKRTHLSEASRLFLSAARETEPRWWWWWSFRRRTGNLSGLSDRHHPVAFGSLKSFKIYMSKLTYLAMRCHQKVIFALFFLSVYIFTSVVILNWSQLSEWSHKLQCK